MPRNHVILNNFQNRKPIEEYKRIQENSNYVALLPSADWAREKIKLQ